MDDSSKRIARSVGTFLQRRESTFISLNCFGSYGIFGQELVRSVEHSGATNRIVSVHCEIRGTAWRLLDDKNFAGSAENSWTNEFAHAFSPNYGRSSQVN